MDRAVAAPAAAVSLPAIRRLARLAAYGAGLTAATALTASGVLIGQARQARRTIPMAEAPPPRGDGVYGVKFPGTPITLVVLGDSSAAGYGVHRPRETPGALLATGISRRLRRPVRLFRHAVVGSLSSGLRPQVEAALEHRPDLAVILIGGNDITNRTPQPVAVRHLVETVRALRTAGAEVVVGTCPDLGAIQPIKPPLRWLARRWSRRLAAAQTVAVVEAGGWTVSLGDLLGPRFAAEPTRMFAWDHFHPSAEGYAIAAAALLPTALSALAAGERPAGAPGDDELRSIVATGPAGVRSLPEAAQVAARHAGTEVSAARVAGRDRGPAGRWARLRRRRPWFGHARGPAPVPGQPPGPVPGQPPDPVPGQPPDPSTATSTVEEGAT
ncbi:SGNH/GDSL hydrolase family protein [Plantactinospora sp. GCM10030261]|uniref:SGNH/GDSL hydrolase family protein n=1 Tax=Plantactinospora sp. GCM10030261 TaxID=3273420 RepID=UPI0036088B5C